VESAPGLDQVRGRRTWRYQCSALPPLVEPLASGVFRSSASLVTEHKF